MPLAKVKQKIVNRAVGQVIPFQSKHYAEKIGPHMEPLLAKFHISLKDADLLPKLEDAKKTKR